jgi:hypothetical protein
MKGKFSKAPTGKPEDADDSEDNNDDSDEDKQ